MRILRTPGARFSSVPDFPFTPKRVDVGDSLEMVWVEDGHPHRRRSLPAGGRGRGVGEVVVDFIAA